MDMGNGDGVAEGSSTLFSFHLATVQLQTSARALVGSVDMTALLLLYPYIYVGKGATTTG